MICPHCGFDNLPGSEECNRCHQDLTQLDRPQAQDRVERSLMEDPVRVLNPRTPVTAVAWVNVRTAIQLLLDHNAGALLVVDEQGSVVGIFTERDVLQKAVGTGIDFDTATVGELMTARPAYVSPEHSLAFALHQMDAGGYRHVPVVDKGQPVAMLSIRDVVRHITRLCES